MNAKEELRMKMIGNRYNPSIKEWFMATYGDDLTARELRVIKILDEIQELITKRNDLLNKLEQCLFGQMWSKRKELEAYAVIRNKS